MQIDPLYRDLLYSINLFSSVLKKYHQSEKAQTKDYMIDWYLHSVKSKAGREDSGTDTNP